jgi:hypothetical protein
MTKISVWQKPSGTLGFCDQTRLTNKRKSPTLETETRLGPYRAKAGIFIDFKPLKEPKFNF